MLEINLGDWPEALAKFLSENRRAATLVLAFILFGLVAFYADTHNLLSDVPRLWIIIVYALAIFSGLIVLSYAALSLFGFGKTKLEDRSKQGAEKERALKNFAAISKEHMACLGYLKKKNEKRFSEPTCSILTAMVSHGYLTREHSTFTESFFEVPDYIWSEANLKKWAKAVKSDDPKPWLPVAGRFGGYHSRN